MKTFMSAILLVAFGLLWSTSDAAPMPRAKKTGEITHYDGGPTACGPTVGAGDLAVAVSVNTFNTFPGATANPNTNPICGKQVKINLGGKSVTAKVFDKCGSCKDGDLDLTDKAFTALAPLGKGRVAGATWDFV